MKKLLGILVLGLLWCNIAKAKECEGSPFVEKKNTLIFFKIFVKWKDCHGSLTYKNGSKYVGGFKNGKLSGQGTFTWGKGKFVGEKYVGEFLKGKRSGLGSHTFTNGDVDYGIWKRGKLIKRLRISKKKSSFDKKKQTELVKQEKILIGNSSKCNESPLVEKTLASKFYDHVVEWKDCHGILIYKDGSKYIGEFKDGKFSEQGTFTYKDGTTYFGEFVEGKFNGQGTHTTMDGKKYVGEWKDNLRHGKGIFTNQLGETYEGEFVQDLYKAK